MKRFFDYVTLISAAGFMWCAAMSALADTSTPGQRIYRVAILGEVGPEKQAVVDAVSRTLRVEGLTVTLLTLDEICDPNRFSRAAFDALLLPDSPRVATPARDALLQYMKSGGDLILLGGRAFSEPRIRIRQQWLTAEQLREVLAKVTPSHTLFGQSALDSAAWRRDANDLNRPSSIAISQVPGGLALAMDFKSVIGWDTFSTKVAPPPAEHNALCFRVRGGPRTGHMLAELDESDGSRWIAPVDVTPQWQSITLPVSAFRYHTGGKQRGGAADALQMDRVTLVSFGVIGGATVQRGMDHQLWIDSVGTAAVEPELQIVEPFRPLFTDDVVNAFNVDPSNQMTEVTSIVVRASQDLVPAAPAITGRFTGYSAVGSALANKSEYLPLLEAIDQYDRRRGWAMGMLIHYGGAYKGGRWLMSGISDTSFYTSPTFLSHLGAAVRAMSQSDLAAESQQRNAQRLLIRLPVTSPAPSGRIAVSPDGKRLIFPDGRPFFMVGVNYMGPSDRPCYFDPNCFDPELIEADFRLAHGAGINCMRIWCGNFPVDPQGAKTILELARRYGIYQLFHIGLNGKTIEEAAQTARKFAEVFGDDPMVIGYDLINEPEVGLIAPFTLNGSPSPVLTLRPYETFTGKFDRPRVDRMVQTRPHWPLIPKWVSDESVLRQIYTALDILESDHTRWSYPPSISLVERYRQLPEGDPWKQCYGAVDKSFDQWIDAQVRAIKSVDPKALVTVGHNSPLATLPCNRQLDFISFHSYANLRRLGSRSADVRDRVASMRTLAEVWPDKPITLGEFGYSNGDDRPSGHGYIDVHASAVAEMAHYLDSLARGQSGAMKWLLNDGTIAAGRDLAPWVAPNERLEGSRYGMYYYDGTTLGRAKPLVPALRALRKLIDRGPHEGRLKFVPMDSPVAVGYVFQNPGALFVGHTDHVSPSLTFHAPQPTNVLVQWHKDELEIVATADITVTLSPSRFVPALTVRQASITGSTRNKRWDGDALLLDLLEGQVVTIHSSNGR